MPTNLKYSSITASAVSPTAPIARQVRWYDRSGSATFIAPDPSEAAAHADGRTDSLMEFVASTFQLSASIQPLFQLSSGAARSMYVNPVDSCFGGYDLLVARTGVLLVILYINKSVWMSDEASTPPISDVKSLFHAVLRPSYVFGGHMHRCLHIPEVVVN
ncbi:hypothetical protein BBK36DRAFT_1143862 [Trichoderma citrinoviride]|uniref:Uncharacterized protein n=1 Tax=Trichoderma citrinoviride TaxID=58853 RepID=A0A2T4B239_9HYPO|nr:hypothetical protein BBK36DRAFT_1143862 [Trichoderma citrinoviride]PTB63370.1 hypothetical protein BBK36DRAFT_1143862 [Trichoderma citrinoviride]